MISSFFKKSKQYNEELKKKFNIETERQAYDDFHNEIAQMQAKTNMGNVQNEINKNIIEKQKLYLMSKKKQDEFNKTYALYADTQMTANANKRQMVALDRRAEDINRENEARKLWINTGHI